MKAITLSTQVIRPARMRARLILSLATVLSVSGIAVADDAFAPGSIGPDGTVYVPSFALPPSLYMSDEAAKSLPTKPTDMEEPMYRALAAGQAGEMRKKASQFMAPRFKHLTELYPVTMRAATIAGVPAMYATPVKPVPARNKHKILLDLPGGGFVMGAADGTGMMESIPLAALAQVEIVSITYRQAPETNFPAASEDVAAVYRELLKTHKAEDIGIFGCSAGGLLTAESMAWFIKEKLPLPAAIGIFCASADARWGGDSRAWARSIQALPGREAPRNYFKVEDLTNPLASPVLDKNVLKQFPPTLIITASRAMEMSSAINTHRELVKAGVDADLHMWDGLGHAFFYNIDLPESREAFAVMTQFFQQHLKLEK